MASQGERDDLRSAGGGNAGLVLQPGIQISDRKPSASRPGQAPNASTQSTWASLLEDMGPPQSCSRLQNDTPTLRLPSIPRVERGSLKFLSLQSVSVHPKGILADLRGSAPKRRAERPLELLFSGAGILQYPGIRPVCLQIRAREAGVGISRGCGPAACGGFRGV